MQAPRLNMTTPENRLAAPCGSWPSPISAAHVAAAATPLSHLMLAGDDVLWLAGRADEGGRNTLLRQHGATCTELCAAPLNVRSRVHEYGGGACLADGDTVYFSNFADNRLYRKRGDADPVPITGGGATRYADFVRDVQRDGLIGVREQHTEQRAYPDNTICAIGADGTETVLVEGNDFYAAPRLSPDGRTLAWLSWDHPRMPWQSTRLWLADVKADGTLANPHVVAGGDDASVCQPEWSSGGVLHFVSDRSGWWNLYRLADGVAQALCPMQAEFGTPHWTFGVSLYGFASEHQIICAYIEQGASRLARLDCVTGKLHAIATPYQEIRELRVGNGFVAVLGGAPTIALELARIDLASGARTILARSIDALPPTAYLSAPESISYPSANGRVAHAFLYQPCNADARPMPGELAPMIVIGHGGPTSMAGNTLKLATQYWTSRGFAVLDVNYGGSSGFGRAYRDLLKGQWGIVDVEDCVAGARHVAALGLADPQRLIIRGGSAGGLTTLCALTFHDVFKVGASYYGVSDLKGLDQDCHKFESHYNDYLIAPPPHNEALYLARSPIHHTDKLARPMIFFQGLDDKVVPPSQSASMVQALRARGVPVAYLALAGEGHGFRKTDSIVRTLEAELVFYLRMFGLTSSEALPPIPIENFPT